MTQPREAEIAASGLTPLDYMMTILRSDENDPLTCALRLPRRLLPTAIRSCKR